MSLVFVLVSGMSAGTTGKIAGVVRDSTTAQLLPGVNIIVEGTQMGAATDANGEYFIINIPPGSYNIAASYIGYATKTITDVLVIIDRTTHLDFDLKTKALEGEEVTISAYRLDVLEPDLTATRQTYDVGEIEILPGITDVGDIINLQADVDGGHFRGGRSGEAIYLIGGAEITNPLTRSRTFDPITIGLEQVEVYTSGFSAEYGNVQSGVINIVPKEGGRNWQTRLDVSSTNSYYKTWGGSVYSPEINEFYSTLLDPEEWLDGVDPVSGSPLIDYSTQNFEETYNPQKKTGWPIPPPPSREDSLRTASLTRTMWLQTMRQMGLEYASPDVRSVFSTGGPLSEKTTMFLAARINSVQPLIPTPFRDRSVQVMGNIVSRMDQNNKLLFIYNYDHEFENGISSNSFRWFEPTVSVPKIITTIKQFGISWNHVFSKSTFMDIKVNQLGTLEEEGIEVVESDQYNRDYSEDSNWRTSKSPSGHEGGKLASTKGYSKTKTFNITGNITSQLNNRNLMRSGFQLNYYDMDVDHKMSTTNPMSMRWDKYNVSPFEGALYFQDKMEYEGFIANVGLRFDFYNFNTDYYSNEFSPYRNPDYEPTNPESGNYYDAEHAEKERTKITSVLQPRIGFSFPVSDKTVLHLNYGVFTQRPAFMYIFVSRLKLDTNPDFERLGNARLKPEKTIAYDMGVVRLLPFGFYLDLSAYYKNVSNLVQNAQYVDKDGFVFNSFYNREYADIKGFHISLDKRDGFVRGNIRYNWESATGQASSPLGAADQVAHYEGESEKDHLRDPKDIFLDFNRLHKLVANLGIQTSSQAGFKILNLRPLANVSLSSTYRFLSGRPFTWDVTGQGLRFNQRTPNEHHMKARLEKGFKRGSTTITAYMEVYNVLNKKVWSYDRTFSEDPENVYRARYMDDSEAVLTETEFYPYVTSLKPYLLDNNPRYYRFGIIFEF
jgi:outer membrane receptor protein involved in Fe transport